MGFEITIVSHTPQTGVQDLDTALFRFLSDIGYLGHGVDSSPLSEVQESIPYRLFRDALLAHSTKPWTIEELMSFLKTSRPTIYRHINRLKALDLLEEISLEEGPKGARKGYRLRYGDLVQAWNFTEAHVRVAIENYRRTVEHLDELARSRWGGESS